MSKPVLGLDIECYRNYFLVMFKNFETDKLTWFEMHEDSELLDVDTIRKILGRFQIVTFNGINYDLPQLFLALTLCADEKMTAREACATLKESSDMIIQTGRKPWHIEHHYKFRIPNKKHQLDHIDLIEVAPGKASLKLYGGRLHCDKMQDLPIDPAANILPEQREPMRLYCGNDLNTTRDLYLSLKEQLQLRQQMSDQYGIDLRSKSDAQIAEAVISKQMEIKTGVVHKRPEVPGGTIFRYKKPSFIEFKSIPMAHGCKLLEDAEYVVNDGGKIITPPAVDKYKVKFGNMEYRIGIGGLHSCEEKIVHRAEDGWVLSDRDVASYYPAIILNCQLYPEHLGRQFLGVYKEIVDRRLAAKASGNKVVADSLKITINGSFGKFGSKWSMLYSPDLLIQTTITGQLSLLMLIEYLEGSGKAHVVSANTDGIVIKYRKSDEDIINQLVKIWEEKTGFVTEETQYKALYSRDVNNFIALKLDGKSKLKGAYTPPGLQKNPNNTICVDAVLAYLKDGVPLGKTIRECVDPRKFFTVRTVNGGAIYKDEYLGKAIRFYFREKGINAIYYKTNGNAVPKSDGAEPCMQMPLVDLEEIDYNKYIKEAESILVDIGERLA